MFRRMRRPGKVVCRAREDGRASDAASPTREELPVSRRISYFLCMAEARSSSRVPRPVSAWRSVRCSRGGAPRGRGCAQRRRRGSAASAGSCPHRACPPRRHLRRRHRVRSRVHLADGRRVAALGQQRRHRRSRADRAAATDEWRRQFEVNVFGTVAVTRALLPRLVESRGRIVNISSISGFVAPPILAPYTASKHALEAFSDALRRELGGHRGPRGGGRTRRRRDPDLDQGTGPRPTRRFEEAPDEVQARYAELVAAVRARSETALRTGMRRREGRRSGARGADGRPAPDPLPGGQGGEGAGPAVPRAA